MNHPNNPQLCFPFLSEIPKPRIRPAFRGNFICQSPHPRFPELIVAAAGNSMNSAYYLWRCKYQIESSYKTTVSSYLRSSRYVNQIHN